MLRPSSSCSSPRSPYDLVGRSVAESKHVTIAEADSGRLRAKFHQGP